MTTDEATALLRDILQTEGLDISFGYGQQIIAYHYLGNRSMALENVLDVRKGVFSDPAGNLDDMAQRLKNCLDQARQADLSPVNGDELLMALVIYNSGHVPPPGDSYWTAWRGNLNSYRAMLDRIRASA